MGLITGLLWKGRYWVDHEGGRFMKADRWTGNVYLWHPPKYEQVYEPSLARHVQQLVSWGYWEHLRNR